MQFPGMTPLQFASAPTVNPQFAALGKSLGALVPKAVPGAAPAAPMDISPAATNAGTNVPPQPSASGILGAIKGMSPQGILDMLKGMSANGQQVMPQGLPGSVLQGAGMLSGPTGASGIPLGLMPGG